MTDSKETPALGKGRDLTTGSVPRHLLAFSLPMLAGSALQTAYSFVNAVWVGKFLGKSALAAVTVSFPVIFVLIAIGMGLTLATNIMISQNYGAKDMPAVRRVVVSSTMMMAVLSLVLLVAGEVFAPTVLRLIGTPPDILPVASRYLQIMLLTLPLGFGLFLIRSMLQGIGNSTTPLYFLAASVLMTAALDPLLMFGWLGFPKLGLNGTAWASVTSQGLALISLVAVTRAYKSPVAPTLNIKEFDWATLSRTLRIGLPSAVQQALISFNMVAMITLVNSFGEDATAAFGAASRIDQVAFLPAMTFSMAIATLAGQNIGAGKYDRIRAIFGWGCLLSGSFTAVASILAVTLPRVLLRAFTDEPVLIDLGAHYLRIVGACYLFFGFMFVSHGIINGSGRTIVTASITIISLWVLRVPLAYWLVSRGAGITGIWYAVGMSFGLSMLGSFAYYFSGRWRKPLVRKTPPSTDKAAAMFGEETGEA